MQAAPELPLLVVDFNGDHAADIVLVSHGGIFGYEQVCCVYIVMGPLLASMVADLAILLCAASGFYLALMCYGTGDITICIV